MITRPLAVVAVALLIAGCSIRVGGIVTDTETGKPIPGCAVTIGPRVSFTTEEGSYLLPVHMDWGKVSFLAPGYVPVSKDVDYTSERDAKLDVALTPRVAPPAAQR